MTTHSRTSNPQQPLALYAPNGRQIVGTADELLATAYAIVCGRHPDGSLAYDYAGESKIHWDTQTPKRDRRGEVLWTDVDGRDWPESSLHLEGEPARPGPGECALPEFHRMTARETSATIEALRYLQRDMMDDHQTTSELTLEEIDDLCERLNFDGQPGNPQAEALLRALVEALHNLKSFGGSGGTAADTAAAAALEIAEQFLA